MAESLEERLGDQHAETQTRGDTEGGAIDIERDNLQRQIGQEAGIDVQVLQLFGERGNKPVSGIGEKRGDGIGGGCGRNRIVRLQSDRQFLSMLNVNCAHKYWLGREESTIQATTCGSGK